jgi:predicted DNA-binding protein (MmcQ/YjbR family)
MSYGQRIRELALSFPETYEDSPWGHPVFKVGDNKMFAAMSDGEALVTLTVKLTPEEREIALHFPHVSVARYVGRYGWVTTEVSDEETLESALEWLRESYWLKAPAKSTKCGGRDLTIPRAVLCDGAIVDEDFDEEG